MPELVDARMSAIARLAMADALFRQLTRFCAVLVLILIGGLALSLVVGAWPALARFGPSFLTTAGWNPVTEQFGALAPLYGTLATAAIALAIAGPLGIGIAIFLTEWCPRWLSGPVALAIELLAGIPSIIYGLWGLFVLAPALQAMVQPAVIAAFSDVPGLNRLFAGPPYGIGLLTAALILALMVLPLIAAIARDVFATVPKSLREAAHGIGATRWEVARHIVIPHARAGLLGAVMLALGRALGETMAVTFVIGNAHRVSASLFAPATTISASIANEFTEADGELYTASLIALGLLLFVITFLILAAARLLLARLAGDAAS